MTWAGEQDAAHRYLRTTTASDLPRLEEQEIVLSAECSRAVARSIISNTATLTRLIGTTIGENSQLTATLPSTNPTVSYAPNLILEYPAFQLHSNDHEFARGYLTIHSGMHSNRPQIWLHFTATVTDDVASFVKETDQLAAEIGKRVIKFYGEILDAALRTEGEVNWVTDIGIRHRMNIALMDTADGRGLIDLYEARYEGESMTRAAKKANEDATFFATALADGLNLEAPKTSETFSHITARGSCGTFAGITADERLVLAGYSTSSDKVIVIVEASSMDELSFPEGPSQQLSAELMRIFAPRF